MRDEALAIQKQLAGETVEINEDGVRVVVNGNQEILELETNEASDEIVRQKINQAFKKAQELAARKLMGMSGGLGGLTGLLR